MHMQEFQGQATELVGQHYSGIDPQELGGDAHGTKVAGLAAGSSVGVASKAALFVTQTGLDTTMERYLEAILLVYMDIRDNPAKQGTSVVNFSWFAYDVWPAPFRKTLSAYLPCPNSAPRLPLPSCSRHEPC